MAERLALPTSDHRVVGSNPAGGEILPEPKRHFIAQSLSCSPSHRLEMTEILLKGRKTLTHPSISSISWGIPILTVQECQSYSQFHNCNYLSQIWQRAFAHFLILPGELHLGGPKPNCHNPGLGAPILYKLPLLPPGGKNISFSSGIQGLILYQPANHCATELLSDSLFKQPGQGPFCFCWD